MTREPRRLLIFEPDHRGHAIEWIEYLLTGAAVATGIRSITFIVAAEIHQAVESFVRSQGSAPGIDIISLKPREQSLCMHSNMAISSFARWHIARRYAARMEATETIFLQFDHLSLPLGLGLRFGRSEVSGILFRPSVHYVMFQKFRPSLKERIRDLRKKILYHGLMNNPCVRTIHSLDPYFPEYAVRCYKRGNKVRPLADPIGRLPIPTSAETNLSASIPRSRIALVLFGEITERKGVLQLLSALTLLDQTIGERLAIVVAGRVDEALLDRINTAADTARACHPNLWLHIENRRLSTGEIISLIQRSHYVIAPYQKFVGSSGVLLWAARLGRPIISQDYGLVGKFTCSYGLGLAVDTTRPEAIADILSDIAHRDGRPLGNAMGMKAFIAHREPSEFSARLLAAHARSPSIDARPDYPRRPPYPVSE